MSQLTKSFDLVLERRRLGFWLVAVGSSLFTIDFGHNRETMHPRYRVTRGSDFLDFSDFDSALGHCSFAARRERKAR